MQRTLLRLAVWTVDRFYHRRLLGGRVPDEGPVILVANHPNGLVDPVLVASASRRCVRFLGKAPLFDMPGLGTVMRGLKALPVYRSTDGEDTSRNEDTFRAVFGALEQGDVICLFPEGVSHSEPVLQRLKTGAARMALGAEDRRGFALGVRVVPVGLVYRANRRFRSQVGVWVGEPIDARAFHSRFQVDEREAVVALTEAISEGLRQVTLELDRWEDLPLIELAERIWRPPGAAGEDPLERMRRFALAVRELRAREPARVDELARRIRGFRERLDVVGASVHDLDLNYTPARVLRFALRTGTALFLGLPLFFLGVALWVLPYRAIPALTRRMAPTRDVSATVQILMGCVFFPLWAAALALGAASLAGWPAGATTAVAAPALGLFALGFLEWRRDAAGDAAVFLRLGLRRRLKEHLRAERDAIAREIEALAPRVEAGHPAGEPASAG